MRQDYLHQPESGRLIAVPEPDRRAIWTDLLNPSAAEEAAVEAELGIDLPTRADMREIEPSARIYSEGGALFMTANVLAGAATAEPVIEPVTFVLTARRVVSIRYHEPYSLQNVPERAAGLQADCGTALQMLMTLMEVLVERSADILEAESQAVDALSRQIFRPATTPARRRAWAFACSTTLPSGPATRNAAMAWTAC